MKTLEELVQALPAELYTEIYDLTFDGTGEHRIKRKYKPPSCLQVSRATRKTFAQTYYGGASIFLIHHKAVNCCVKWIVRLPQSHAHLITEIRVVEEPARRLLVPGSSYREWSLLSDKVRQKYLALPCTYGLIGAGVIKFQLICGFHGASEWIRADGDGRT